jgi:CRISPR/Cas system-associated exonuclease Cas4 (RecB family)
MTADTPWYLKNYKNALISKGRLLPVIEKLLIKEQLESTRDTLHLHPSEICKKDWCPRSSWYTIKGYEKKEDGFTLQKLNIFAEGHSIHGKWQKWLLDAGVLEQAEVPIYNEEYHLMGHADGIVNDKQGRAILEIKSVGAGTIRMEDYELFKSAETPEAAWKKVRQPFPSHLRQLNLYMYCLDIHDGIFIYEWKATQFSVKFQPNIVEDILSGCKSVIRGLDSGIPPMRPTLAESSSSKICKGCPYAKVCWKDDYTD